MISRDTIASITGRLGIGLISTPIVAKAASSVREIEQTTRHFYEVPIEWLGGIDGMGISFIFGVVFMGQGIILRTIKIKKELKDTDE